MQPLVLLILFFKMPSCIFLSEAKAEVWHLVFFLQPSCIYAAAILYLCICISHLFSYSIATILCFCSINLVFLQQTSCITAADILYYCSRHLVLLEQTSCITAAAIFCLYTLLQPSCILKQPSCHWQHPLCILQQPSCILKQPSFILQ